MSVFCFAIWAVSDVYEEFSRKTEIEEVWYAESDIRLNSEDVSIFSASAIGELAGAEWFFWCEVYLIFNR